MSELYPTDDNGQFLGDAVRPEDVVMSAGVQTFHEVFLGVWLLLAILVGIVQLRRSGDRRLLICMLAGFTSVILEAHTIYMLKFFYPTVGQHVLLDAFGNQVPVLMGLEYAVFQGTAMYIYLKSPTKTVGIVAFLGGMFVLIAAEAAVEITSVSYGVWYYFGDQPFTVMGFPIHVAVIVCGILMINGAIAKVWFDLVKGPRQFLWIIVGPIFLIAVFTALAYPVTWGLYSQEGVQVARIGALVSILLSFVGSYYALRLPALFERKADEMAVSR